MKKVIYLTLLLSSFLGCKRFESNAYNLKMIQNSWIAESIWSKRDSALIKIPNSLSLTFIKNTCTEQYIDSIPKSINYKFQISNYQLQLVDSVNNKKNLFIISKLVKDTLVLENDSYKFTYITTENKQ